MSHPDPRIHDTWADVDAQEIDRVVVVGGGPAAHRCTTTLRKLGFTGEVDLISGETTPPYDRTLLSKDNLVDSTRQIAEMAPSTTYEELGINLQLGHNAIGIDATANRVELADGSALPYDRCVLAVGGTPILPKPLAAPGVLTMRTVDDVGPIRDALERSRHVVIIGAGFIGGELAAAATTLGAAVTLIDGFQVPLEGALGADVGSRVAALHTANGIALRCGVHADSVSQEHDGYTIELTDGTSLNADSVIVGAGMRPATNWLSASGIDIDRAILTDSQCRTSLPRVFAVGDCAQWWSARYASYCHVEHWDTAGKHGAAGARAVLGQPADFDPVPFFWSDQYDVKYQWAGYAPNTDTVDIDETSPRDFSARYSYRGELVGVLTANRPREFARLRRELMAPQKAQQEVKEVVPQ